jgi:superfamily II DNA or RNA helicase
MLEIVREGLQRSDQVDIAIAFLRFSGLGLLEKDIEQFLNRGGQLRVLASTYLGHTQPNAIRALRDISSINQVRIFDSNFPGFHMKLFLFNGQEQEIWVGSTNLTKGGLTTNWEMNLCYRDKLAFELGKTEFDIAWSNSASKEPTEKFIKEYEERIKNSIVDQNWMVYQNNQDREERPSFDMDIKSTDHKESAKKNAKRIEPNEAQKEAMQRLQATRENQGTKALIVAAPGVGKTYLSAFDARQAGAKKVLFLSHRLEHLRQAQKSYCQVFPELSQTICDGGNFRDDGDQVFATVQSARKRENLHNRHWDYVVVDEFHHAEAPSYQELIAKLSYDFLLGLTATPERADGHNVWRLCDNHIAYEVRLTDAINRRWLVPFHYFVVGDDVIEYETIPWRSGGFDPTALENALSVEDRAELIIRHALLKGFDGTSRTTVGFCAGQKHAKFMASYFNKKGMISATVLGDDPIENRLDIYNRFANPKDPLEWLFVADILNEGVDIPAINSILFLRPSDSATVFIQQLGRGLRLHPDCEVLTVIDFVGHHRKSWLGLKAINDPAAMSCARSLHVADTIITPPRDCEIVLDDKTQEILAKVGKFRSKNQVCKDAYETLRLELSEPPFPQDLFGRKDIPSLKDFRDTFGCWLNCRIQMNDAAPWEIELSKDHPLYQLLDRSEQDWQAPRIYPYAFLWGAIAYPENPGKGYIEFFERFTQWKVEWKSEDETKVSQTMERKLGLLWTNGSLISSIFEIIPKKVLLDQIEKRIGFVIQKDYKSRHGGVLRQPHDLEIWKQYSRPEIINFFGQQYDPAVHNSGVITFSKDHPFPEDIIIITKIDTSGAHEQYQYNNNFEDNGIIFRWQSQNSNNPKSGVGKRLVTPGLANLHLFVQPKSHTPAVYCGQVSPIRYESSNPIDVWFRLPSPVPLESFNNLKE